MFFSFDYVIVEMVNVAAVQPWSYGCTWEVCYVPLWPLAGFVLGRPEFKFSATLVNSQLVVSCQLWFLILLCCI